MRAQDQVVAAAPDERLESPLPVTIIRSSQRASVRDLVELWAYRELLYFLIWRDLKVRYRQTVLGAAGRSSSRWLTMVVFALFFGRLAQDAVGRRALPGLQLRGAGAVDVLRQRR